MMTPNLQLTSRSEDALQTISSGTYPQARNQALPLVDFPGATAIGQTTGSSAYPPVRNQELPLVDFPNATTIGRGPPQQQCVSTVASVATALTSRILQQPEFATLSRDRLPQVHQSAAAVNPGSAANTVAMEPVELLTRLGDAHRRYLAMSCQHQGANAGSSNAIPPTYAYVQPVPYARPAIVPVVAPPIANKGHVTHDVTDDDILGSSDGLEAAVKADYYNVGRESSHVTREWTYGPRHAKATAPATHDSVMLFEMD